MQVDLVTTEQLEAAVARLTAAIQESAASSASGALPAQVYFTKDEAAQYLRMSTRNLDLLTVAGDIRRANVGTGGKKASVLYRRVDLDAFVDARMELDRHEVEQQVRRSA